MMKNVRQFIIANRFIIFLLFIILPFRFVHIQDNLTSITNFRQAQTATFALNFYKHGINLSQTELDIFGIGKERFLTLEFPLYEAMVAILFKIFFISDMWGRMVSVIAGLIGAIYLFKVVDLILHNRVIACLSSFFFLFIPLNMVYQQDFMIESTVICFLLIGLYYFSLFTLKRDGLSYILYLVFISLGFIQKGLYGPFWLITVAVFYFSYNVKSYRNLLKFIIIIAVPLLVLFFWQIHVNTVNTINGNEYFTSSNRSQVEWNIGTFQDRFSISLWEYRLSQMGRGIFMKPGIIFFIVGLFAFRKIGNRHFFYSWLLAALIYFLFFFRIQSHNYYQMIMTPVLSCFMAVGLWWFAKKIAEIIDNNHKKIIIAVVIFLSCSFYIWRSWINSQWGFITDLNWYNRLQLVGRSVPYNSYGIFVNPYRDWNSVYTYYPKLKMKIVGPENVTPENVLTWKINGYSYLILHNYSDYLSYFKEIKLNNSLDFLNNFNKIIEVEDFKVYLIEK